MQSDKSNLTKPDKASVTSVTSDTGSSEVRRDGGKRRSGLEKKKEEDNKGKKRKKRQDH